MPGHLVTVVAALSMLPALLFRRRQIGRFAAVIWSVLTAEFWLRRFVAGPHTAAQGARLLLSSIAIPPVAVARRLHGEWMFRHIRRDPPLAVLFDRDDTIIEDGPYLNDPAGVRPMPGAAVALDRLRRRGLLLGVVSNQSGVAKGLITHEQLAAVNAEVDVSLGPFDVWQVCPHDADDRCRCRKPLPAMVFAAAAALGVPTSRCVLIGDTGADVDAALAAHAEAVLVPTERTLSKEVAAAHRQARVASSLAEAVTMVLRDCS